MKHPILLRITPLCLLMPGAAYANLSHVSLRDLLPFLIAFAPLILLPPLLPVPFAASGKRTARYFLGLAIWIGTLVVGCMAWQFTPDQAQHEYRHAAESWTLNSVETRPETQGGVMVGFRVKAMLQLNEDINALSPWARAAVRTPFNLMAVVPLADGGYMDFSPHYSGAVVRKDGVVVSEEAPTASKGSYEVERDFLMWGVARARQDITLPMLARSDYFKQHTTLPDADLLCRTNQKYVSEQKQQMARFDAMPIGVQAFSSYHEGGWRDVNESRYTAFKPTPYVYHHQKWIDDLARLPLPDCEAVHAQIRQEIAEMEKQLEALKERKRVLSQEVAQARSTDDVTEMSKELEEIDVTLKSASSSY